jgi:hypothetical protein
MYFSEEYADKQPDEYDVELDDGRKGYLAYFDGD